MEGFNRGENFLKITEERAKKYNYKPQLSTTLFQDVVIDDDSDFEVFLFANYDICNFTRYKRNNKNWTELLQKFVFSGVNFSSTEWPMQFWKFNGDSLTYRKKIQSTHEICEFVSKAYFQLKSFQEVLNSNQSIKEKVYIRGCIWISGFKKRKDDQKFIANNITFQKQQFGQEFVGENVDEGFRLSACAKASNLAVDPKIVYILNIYKRILEDNDKSCPPGFDKTDFQEFLSQKTDIMPGNQIGIARKILSDVINNIFLMEFQHCKGVWDDRAYPVFWYIDDLSKKEFVYDDIVDGNVLLAHRINKYDENEEEFQKSRNQIIDICAQVGAVDSIKSLLMNLNFFPDSSASGEYIFDMAKLYYMVACVLVENDERKGVLIFKRSNERHHLKNVWDLIPVKHARVKTKSNISFIETYLKKMLIEELCIDNSCDEYGLDNKISIDMDEKRNSVKPWSLCNIYRNGEVHNGIMCVANIDIGNNDPEVVVETIKSNIAEKNKKYADVKLVTYEDVEMCTNDKEYDIFTLGDLKIRTLQLQEISDNSDNVCNDYKYNSVFEKIQDEDEYGTAYLGYSIKQILKDGK